MDWTKGAEMKMWEMIISERKNNTWTGMVFVSRVLRLLIATTKLANVIDERKKNDSQGW